MDWLFRRRDAEPQRPEPRELLPICLYSADVIVPGRCDPRDQRITDILARGDDLAILPNGADPEDPDSWLAVNADALLLIVPPPHVSPSELRVHRQRQEVQLRIGPYRVTGTAHLRPGESDDPFLRATRPFLPLTQATIEQADGPTEHVDVVIANFRKVEEFREV